MFMYVCVYIKFFFFNIFKFNRQINWFKILQKRMFTYFKDEDERFYKTLVGKRVDYSGQTLLHSPHFGLI